MDRLSYTIALPNVDLPITVALIALLVSCGILASTEYNQNLDLKVSNLSATVSQMTH